ncbi:MAG TPA: tRNA (guanosine(46)-N7)-methyltransferase TrmB [Candidatus Udaeobacter sp.]|nr:tRNA (guanosine(46)-N7)-methyltransferase TrmB [Candidatus Udaeobacter sp.]
MPADEGTSAHRRHVCSRLIQRSQFSLTNRLHLEEIFGRDAPLHVDLGCGEGSFLCAMAQRLPEKNFLGIERLVGRVRSAARKAADLNNVRLLHIEISYAVRYLLPAESVETFYLLFPDPWPKRRHHRRRTVTEDFVNTLSAAVCKGGVIYIATDHLEYFRKIKEIASSVAGLADAGIDLGVPSSKFAGVFQQQGAPIYRVALRKVSPVR